MNLPQLRIDQRTKTMISRRELLTALLFTTPTLLGLPSHAGRSNASLQHAIADLERTHGGRLGVAILDTAGNKLTAYRGDERFPLCSTHKALAAAFILARVDRKQESLTRRIVYTDTDLVPYSPITGKHVGKEGMTVGEICEAAITLSDNTAANLMLSSFGGPAALTAYLRSLGDNVTRLDRREPDLNEALPGDPRDTTSPTAMLETLHKIALGTALSVPSRRQLIEWLTACKTGENRLRAGAPKDWRVADKTGSGNYNTANDIAIFWPNSRQPIIVTAYYTGGSASADERNAVLSEVGRLAATA